jgi:hypothetical protein
MSRDEGEIASRWRTLAGRFPLWRMPFDLLFHASSWRMFGADLVGIVLSNSNARAAARDLKGATPETLEALSSVAAVNVERTGEIFKAVFIGYVSLPLGLGALLSDAAPDTVRTVLSEQSAAIVIFLGGAIVFPILFFCGAWRAKQIAWVLSLYRAGALTPPLPKTT